MPFICESEDEKRFAERQRIFNDVLFSFRPSTCIAAEKKKNARCDPHRSPRPRRRLGAHAHCEQRHLPRH